MLTYVVMFVSIDQKVYDANRVTSSIDYWTQNIIKIEPCHEKTCFLRMRKKDQISCEVTAKLISVLVYATIPLLSKSEISSL